MTTERDEQTLGELARRLTRLDEAIRQLGENVTQRLERVLAMTVDQRLFEVERARLNDRIGDLETNLGRLERQVEQSRERAAAAWRLGLSGLIFPIAVALITAVLFAVFIRS